MVQPLCLYTVFGFEGVLSLQKLVDVCGETFVVETFCGRKTFVETCVEVGEAGCAQWLPHRTHCLGYPKQHLVTPLAWVMDLPHI